MLATIISAVLLMLAGCGGGGGGGGGIPAPTLPADAVTITDTNAMDVTDSAIGTIAVVDALRNLKTGDAQDAPSMLQIIDMVKGKVLHREHSDNVVTGVSNTYNCTYGGTISVNYSETATSESGSVTFSNCNEGSIVFNGRATYTSNWNNSTGAYSDTLNASLTISYSGQSFTFVMDLDDNGNESSGAYNETVSYSVSGIPGGGFLVTTTQTLVGNYFYHEIYSGELMIQGANNTRLRVRVTATNYAEIAFDNGNGQFVVIDPNFYLGSYL